LIQYFEAGKGSLTTPQILQLFTLYDNDEDGFLDEPDAVLYVRDVLDLCPSLKDDLLKVKPLTKTDEEFMKTFGSLAYVEMKNINGQEDSLTSDNFATCNKNINRFLRLLFDKSKQTLNPAMSFALAKRTEELMMDYEFKETMAGMNDREKYAGAFREEVVPNLHKNMFAVLNE